jgi:hypothetical protein
MTGEGPGKAVAIVFAGEHGINGGSQHVQTKLRHKGPMRFVIGIIVRQWSNAATPRIARREPSPGLPPTIRTREILPSATAGDAPGGSAAFPGANN